MANVYFLVLRGITASMVIPVAYTDICAKIAIVFYCYGIVAHYACTGKATPITNGYAGRLCACLYYAGMVYSPEICIA